jgi:hypothetical protein
VDEPVNKDEDAGRGATGFMWAGGISAVHVVLTDLATSRLATNANVLPRHGRRSLSRFAAAAMWSPLKKINEHHCSARGAQLIHPNTFRVNPDFSCELCRFLGMGVAEMITWALIKV